MDVMVPFGKIFEDLNRKKFIQGANFAHEAFLNIYLTMQRNFRGWTNLIRSG